MNEYVMRATMLPCLTCAGSGSGGSGSAGAGGGCATGPSGTETGGVKARAGLAMTGWGGFLWAAFNDLPLLCGGGRAGCNPLRYMRGGVGSV